MLFLCCYRMFSMNKVDYKATKTVRISKFIWQRVSDWRASVIKVRQPYVLSRQRGTVRRFRLAGRRLRGAASEAGMRWSARYRVVWSCRHITPRLIVFNPIVNIQPVGSVTLYTLGWWWPRECGRFCPAITMLIADFLSCGPSKSVLYVDCIKLNVRILLQHRQSS